MTNEKIVEFFKNRPNLFVDLIFRWYPINLRVMFKILNNISDRVTVGSYDKLLQNETIIKDLLFIEVALGDPSQLHKIIKNSYHKLPAEFIKKHLMNVKNYYSNSDIGKLSTVNIDDITDELISKLKAEENLTEKYKDTNYKWDIEQIENYKRQNGFSFSKLSANQGNFWIKEMPWSEDIIHFLTKNLESKQTYNRDLKQTLSCWYHVENPSIPWSFEILEEYEYFWDLEKLISSQKVWDTLFKDVLTEELVLSIINNSFYKNYSLYYKNYRLSESNEYTFNFSANPVFYIKNQTLDYGKYKGKKIIEILNEDTNYINELIESSDPFYMEIKYLKEFEKNSGYKFSDKAYKMAYKKMFHNDKDNLRYYDEMNNNEDFDEYYKKAAFDYLTDGTDANFDDWNGDISDLKEGLGLD